jgi:subtilase family protein
MRIPVITVLPADGALTESALAMREGRAPTIPLSQAKAPPGVTIDPTFPAIPLGSATGPGMTLETLQPKQSAKFAVRGFVEVSDVRNVPPESDGNRIFSDPKIAPFITCGGSSPVGTNANVAQQLRVTTLAQNGLDGDGVAVAIMDTGINLAHLANKLGSMPRFDAGNSWTVPGDTTLPGQHPVDHGTMCAYDALIAAPKATLLDFPILSNNAPGGSIMAGTLSVALLAFAQLLASWGVGFAPGGPRKYKALVLNNSWGIFHPSWDLPPGHPGRYCDNPNHPFNLVVGTLARTNADIIFAAGNCGAQCADMRCNGRVTGPIMGASAIPEVLTLAGCDCNDQRVGYSSQGPSIAGMFQDKPDITAYTHFRGSEAFGSGSPDSGTSTACPVAAGCVAALRTKVAPSTTPPVSLFQQLMTTARKVPGQTGWNRDYGHGIIDPVTTGQSLGVVAGA